MVLKIKQNTNQNKPSRSFERRDHGAPGEQERRIGIDRPQAACRWPVAPKAAVKDSEQIKQLLYQTKMQ